MTHKEGVRLTKDRLATERKRRAVAITATMSAEMKVRTNGKTNGQLVGDRVSRHGGRLKPQPQSKPGRLSDSLSILAIV